MAVVRNLSTSSVDNWKSGGGEKSNCGDASTPGRPKDSKVLFASMTRERFSFHATACFKLWTCPRVILQHRPIYSPSQLSQYQNTSITHTVAVGVVDSILPHKKKPSSRKSRHVPLRPTLPPLRLPPARSCTSPSQRMPDWNGKRCRPK